MKRVAICVVLLLLSLLGLGIAIPRMGFKPHWDTYSVQVCRLGGAPCELDDEAKQVWSDDNIDRYCYPKGVGFKMPFKKVLADGKDAWTKTFTLKRWEKAQEGSNNGERADFVDAQKREFSKMLTWWRSPQADHRSILLVTDITGKIDEKESQFIARNWAELRLDDGVNAGDSLDMTTCLVTAEPDAACGYVRIKEGEKQRAAEIQPQLDSITKQNPTELLRTALYERLRSILAEKKRLGQLPEYVGVYTDGMEFTAKEAKEKNRPTEGLLLVNFYEDERLLDESKWGELTKAVEPDGQKWPDLTGVQVQIFRPHRQMKEKEAMEVDAALKFMAAFLTGRNASVQVITE